MNDKPERLRPWAELMGMHPDTDGTIKITYRGRNQKDYELAIPVTDAVTVATTMLILAGDMAAAGVAPQSATPPKSLPLFGVKLFVSAGSPPTLALRVSPKGPPLIFELAGTSAEDFLDIAREIEMAKQSRRIH